VGGIMKHKIIFILFCLAALYILDGCTSTISKETFNFSNINQYEGVSYDSFTFSLTDNPIINIQNNFGDVDIYGWRRNDIKIEISNYFCKDCNGKEKCCFECYASGNIAYFESKHNEADYKINLTVFVPRNMQSAVVELKEGDIIFHDRFCSDIDVSTYNGNITLKSFEGRINSRINAGDILFDNVVLKGKNSVDVTHGNIIFKGNIISNHTSSFKTQFGNVQFSINSKLSPLFECKGAVEENSLVLKKIPLKDNDGKIIISCSGGSIRLSEFENY